MARSATVIDPNSVSERSGLSEQRRRDLADFLRTRREKLKPESVGLSQQARRRTPGLRREEVAELAGVGTTWYTWLEQARDIQPSSDVLTRLARALMMNPVETRHMFALAGKAAPSEVDGKIETPSEPVLRFIEHGLQVPALLLGARWDLLRINSHAMRTFPHLKEFAAAQENWLRYYFLKMERERLRAWDVGARRLIAEFRASLSHSLDHPWVTDLIEKLREQCVDFNDMWREHDVRDNIPTIVELDTPDNGFTRFERMVLQVPSDSRLRILIFSPAE